MKKIIFFAIVIIGASKLLTAFAPEATGGSSSGHYPSKELVKVKVIKVLDGDTVDVHDGRNKVRVRLQGIDCPESNQRWGDMAGRYMDALIGGEEVGLGVVGKDRYGRTLGIFFVGDENVNRFMVEQGHCWVYPHYARDAKLFELEKSARNAHLGLWSSANPEAPWEWRKRNKKKAGSK